MHRTLEKKSTSKYSGNGGGGGSGGDDASQTRMSLLCMDGGYTSRYAIYGVT